MFIIVIATLALVIALFAGIRTAQRRFWDYVDLVYYPAGIIGVLLIFFETSDLRDIAKLQSERDDHEWAVSDLEKRRPEAEVGSFDAENLTAWAALLTQVAERAESCGDLNISTEQCLVDQDMQFYFQEASIALSSYIAAEDLAEICLTGSSVFDEMARISRTSKFLASRASDAFHQGIIAGFKWFEYEASINILEEAINDMRSDAVSLASDISINPAQREFASKIYEAEVKNLALLLRSFAVCLRADEAIRTGEFKTWLDSYQEAGALFFSKDEELARAKERAGTPNEPKKFRITWWPYVLIAALSLKFGKGVASTVWQ